ncbi:MAG: LPXTG cell wall anchor domain-containing protein, partial [Chitinophagales bacterium]
FFDQLHKVFFCISCLFSVITSYSQNKVAIRTSIDKNNIVIGEPIHFSLEADFPLHEPMSFFTIDSIPHFEILERKKIDTIDNNEGIKLSQTLTITSFDSGHWVIPSFELTGDKPLFSDTIPVNVGFSPFDPSQDYHDIKDIINVQAEKKKEQNWYWFAGISALLLAAIIYLFIRKKKKPAVQTVFIDPYTGAKQELERLRKENLPSKLFYTRLVDIFRLYLSRRKKISSLQETTDELVLQLRQLKLTENDFDQLAQTLRMSDFVKFAKYEPNEKDKIDSFNITRHSIDMIESANKTETKNLDQ